MVPNVIKVLNSALLPESRLKSYMVQLTWWLCKMTAVESNHTEEVSIKNSKYEKQQTYFCHSNPEGLKM